MADLKTTDLLTRMQVGADTWSTTAWPLKRCPKCGAVYQDESRHWFCEECRKP